MASKIATICAFLSVSLAIVFAWLSPATGDELDFYSDTPFFTWVFIIASCLLAPGLSCTS
jgi:H+/Cl- antiporter ClcA